MFCEQCEQTASGNGCHQWGACGKSPEVNAVQDLLVYCLRGLASVVLKAKEAAISTCEADIFTCESLFATMTNVNFDQRRFTDYIQRCLEIRENLKAQLGSLDWSALANYQPNFNESLVSQGQEVSLELIEKVQDLDIFSLKLTAIYGVKGLASYTFHAQELGQEDDSVYQVIQETLAAIDRSDLNLNDWVAICLKVGAANLRAMELLDQGHTETYGHPIPTNVPLNPRLGKAILVSGHDIKQLAALLAQTANTGITVYTHGELLPAHGYPKLKEKYPHLYGHYGTAWQNQTKEFAKFPGAIVLTTNCLMPPHENYESKLFTLGPVGYAHINRLETVDGAIDFSPVIAKAQSLPGFTEISEPRQVMVGFAHNTVLSVADTVVDALKQGKIRHFFLVGGCDGAKP